MPEEDRHGYAEGLRRGGYIVAVTADEANYTRVLDILDRDGSVDMDEREASWRKEGWTGSQAGKPAVLGATPAPAVASAATQTRLVDDRAVSAAPAQSTAATGAAGTVAAGSEEVVPVYEEELRVGKRDVSHGRVRLRSYVVETPVREQIGLREERVSVERRPVDRAVTGLSGGRVQGARHRGRGKGRRGCRLEGRSPQGGDHAAQGGRRTDRNRLRHGAAHGSRCAGRSRLCRRRRGPSNVGFDIVVREHDRRAHGRDRIRRQQGGNCGSHGRLRSHQADQTASPDGQHHLIPLSWVDHIDQHVHLNKAPEAVRAGW